MPVSRGVRAGSARSDPVRSVHTTLEVFPTTDRKFDVSLWELLTCLLKDMEENKEVLRSPVEDPKELPPKVTTEFAEFATNLRAVRKWRRRVRRSHLIESL